jgi:HD-GYP domain-containing protein (c-di-GMP phosphodiesterase class II)
MASIRLHFPVYTLEKKQLLPAGSSLAEETLLELIADNKVKSQSLYSFMDHGTVNLDLHEFGSRTPYRNIFEDQSRTADMFDLIKQVQLHPAILESLDYFKKHDFYTYRHILMVFALSVLLARDLLPDHEEVLKEVMTGPTHDVGKICVPMQILKKEDLLTRTERSLLEHHAGAGFVLLSYYLRDSMNFASRVARDHHERKDASGYPAGTFLDDPMVEIVAAADIYDALISPRPYRPTSYDNRTALEELTSQAEDGRIGWEVVQALVAYNRKDKPHYLECNVSLDKRGTPPPDNRYGLTIDDEHDSEDSSA